MPRFRSPSSAAVVAPFAEGVIAADLPALGQDRRRATVEFVIHRIDTMPSVTRLGVLLVATVVRVALVALPVSTCMRLIGPVPLAGEYLRLIRSLSIAYVFETWPGTGHDGGRPDA